jgi:ubiquinone/menaquinone biosynthesis C-methylase UbiE
MTTGSSYEVYDRTHLTYDKTRLPVGNDQLAQIISRDYGLDAHILDLGCGTGGHLEGLKGAGFNKLVGLDASLTGLKQAAAKLPDIQLLCADMRAVPLADASFDVLLFSFSLHHLPHNSETELKAATLGVFKEAARLLKSGGCLIAITCSQEQLAPETGCLWYYKYFPEAARKLSARFLSADALSDLAAQAQFSQCRSELVERTYWTEASLDLQGPLDQSWRNGDSLFALAAQDERFSSQIEVLKADIASGAAQKHVEAVRARSEQVKQALIFTARKPHFLSAGIAAAK